MPCPAPRAATRASKRVALRSLALAALAVLASAGRAANAAPDTLEERIQACAACHGKRGEGLRANEYFPAIAGKPAGYLYDQLVNFRDRRRQSATMNYMVAFLSDAYLREIADHYAALPSPPAPPPAAADRAILARGEALVLRGDRARDIPACTACHGKALTGMQPSVPGLLGLDPRYVAAQIGAWRSGLRRAKEPDCMATIASLLGPGDISAIAAWLASRSGAERPPPLAAGALKPPARCGSIESPDVPRAAAAAPASRGEYLVAAGSCRSCHTQPGGPPFAGGRPIPTPFGTIYSTNLTPDVRTGIGRWSADDFRRALHEGVAPDGSYLYPAFPYTSYTKVTRADADAMFEYLRGLAPVERATRAPQMRFPYDKRALLAGWRALYFRAGEYRDDPKRSPQWNRGAYLVQGLGHCSACHAPRNAWGAVTGEPRVGGGLIPMLNWYAPSLAASRETGLGDWQPADIESLLSTGVSPRGAVFGPMAEVVRDSLQRLAPEDIAAIAAYLKSQREEEEGVRGSEDGIPAPVLAPVLAAGERIYRDRCSDCHGEEGRGDGRAYPPLADNESILMPDPVNAIRMTLNGGFAPSTAGNPRPYGMPPFAHLLADDQVAAVVTYIRRSWGNDARPVSPVEVAAARGVPLD
ncbi:MAG TPA: c-type cytochrome [Usitatibacter sp.]|nr:c-type cytochrome [Usitatibacter sp.]